MNKNNRKISPNLDYWENCRFHKKIVFVKKSYFFDHYQTTILLLINNILSYEIWSQSVQQFRRNFPHRHWKKPFVKTRLNFRSRLQQVEEFSQIRSYLRNSLPDQLQIFVDYFNICAFHICKRLYDLKKHKNGYNTLI